MKVKSESEVAQSCLTWSDPMDCSLSGSSVHGILLIPFPLLSPELLPFSRQLGKLQEPGMRLSVLLQLKSPNNSNGGFSIFSLVQMSKLNSEGLILLRGYEA